MMDREAYLRICKKCQNRKMDFKLGLVCGLTGKHADFDVTCDDFLADEIEVQKEREQKEKEKELIREIQAYNKKSKKINNSLFILKIIVYAIIGIVALIALISRS